MHISMNYKIMSVAGGGGQGGKKKQWKGFLSRQRLRVRPRSLVDIYSSTLELALPESYI